MDPPPKSGDRYQVVVSVDGDVLAFDTDGECALHNGPALAPETVRRLSCDASAVLMVRGPTGEVLDIGRKTRTIPPAIKRALRTRDTTNHLIVAAPMHRGGSRGSIETDHTDGGGGGRRVA